MEKPTMEGAIYLFTRIGKAFFCERKPRTKCIRNLPPEERTFSMCSGCSKLASRTPNPDQ